MIPLGDDNTGRRRVPVVTFLLIAANVFVFVFLQGLGSNERFTYAFATVPAEIVTNRDIDEPVLLADPITEEPIARIDLAPTPIPVWLTLFTAMFMHGGLAHLLGNMLYLWIFGDNVEDDLGRGRFLFFYVLCGVLAGLAHVMTTVILKANPYIPSLGASGAISGVLAAYLVLHPQRRVSVLFFYSVAQVPAIVAIGLWFVFQLISGLGMLGAASQAGGVAYGAHIGGFIAGFVLVKLFQPRRRAALA
jgi:membrane associated rhomboid family serine protease